MLLVDEAAVVEDGLYKALRPMIATSRGELWLMSTPRGKRGLFYETWVRGGAEWERVSVRATECARIPAEFLEEEMAESGELWFRQEYMCEFVDRDGGVFDRELVEGAVDGSVRPLDMGGSRWME